MSTSTAPTPPTVVIASQFPFAALLDAVTVAHRQELVELAVRADEAASNASRGGPWTGTPGSDALATMHPDMVIDFTTDTIPQSRSREIAAARWGLQ